MSHVPTSKGRGKAHPLRRAFTLLETLVVVGVLSTVAAGGFLLMGSIRETATDTKLRSDVAALNSAVRAYMGAGGTFPASASANAVLSQLKASASDSISNRLAAAGRRALIDPRLVGTETTAVGPARAVWNRLRQRFEIANRGAGFSEFRLTDSPTPVAPAAEDSRRTAMLFADESKWVWNFDEPGQTRSRAVTAKATREVAQLEPTGRPAARVLEPPTLSMSGGLWDFGQFPDGLPVTLIDPNPPGAADLYYRIDDGPWELYTGQPIIIPPRLVASLQTYASPADPESHMESRLRIERYETIYFSGRSRGVFHDPEGPKTMITNLEPGERAPMFEWGSPSTQQGFTKGNQLTFTGNTFATVAPEQEFQVGTLTYYNSTTQGNTTADTVRINIDLELTTPGAKESLDFTFRLLSTPNKNKDPDEDADYVWIPDVSTSFNTTIKGQRFFLVLRFGKHSEDGFTTIDTFHAHEGKTLSGGIYGRFTTRPPDGK